MTVRISLELLFFNIERLDISCASIAHPCQKWRPSALDLSFRVHLRASLYIMCLKRISEWKVMTIWFSRELHFSISSISIYHRPRSYVHVKSYGRLNWTRASVLNFERLDKLCAWIGHPSEMLWPFEFLDNYHFSISSISIYHGPQSYTHVNRYGRLNWTWASVFNFERLVILWPESDIRVKCYDHFNYLITTNFQFRASRYIMGLNRTPMSTVMAVWIGTELPCLILNVSIYYVPESDIRVKCYDHLNYLITTNFQFRTSRYIMGLNRTPMSNVMAIWIGPELPCIILNVSIYYVPESNIRVKCYDHFNYSITTNFQFWASLYIMCLNRTPMSEVMAVWIGPELPGSITSVSIYYVPESDMRVKCYDHLNFPSTSVIKFQASWYIMGLNRTSMLKVMAIWIGPELPCSILNVSIYYVPESDIRVKCYDHFNYSITTNFQFRASLYIMCLNRTPMSNVMAV